MAEPQNGHLTDSMQGLGFNTPELFHHTRNSRDLLSGSIHLTSILNCENIQIRKRLLHGPMHMISDSTFYYSMNFGCIDECGQPAHKCRQDADSTTIHECDGGATMTRERVGGGLWFFGKCYLTPLRPTLCRIAARIMSGEVALVRLLPA